MSAPHSRGTRSACTLVLQGMSDDEESLSPEDEAALEAAAHEAEGGFYFGQPSHLPAQTPPQQRTAILASERPPSPRPGEMPSPVTPVLTKVAPKCADPGSPLANMEHFRNGMMIDVDPLNEERTLKFYDLVTPEWSTRKVPDDGLARSLFARCNSLLKYTDWEAELVVQAQQQIERALRDDVWKGVRIAVHVPMQQLLPETDDRAIGGVEGDTPVGFALNEEMILKRGRNSWRGASANQRLLGTRVMIGLDQGRDARNSLGNLMHGFVTAPHITTGPVLTFRYDKGTPVMELGDGSGFNERVSQKFRVKDHQRFADAVDFATYNERELAACWPADYVPMKSLQLVAAACDTQGPRRDEARAAAILTHVGNKIRNDEGSWWTWNSSGWTCNDGDDDARTKVKAAGTDLEEAVREIAGRPDAEVILYRAIEQFDLPVGEGNMQENPGGRMKSCRFVPTSDRGICSLLTTIQPWVKQKGFAKSFENCKDVAFLNGVQQMRPPFAFHPATPADHVLVSFSCDLPPAAASAEELARRQEIALAHFLDLFGDREVALREFDKAACLLTGTCAVLPEANFRPMLGPYDEESGRYATRCGKNTLLTLLKTLLGDAIDDSYPAAFLSMVMEPGRNYSFMKGIESKLGHWIDEGEAQQHGATDTNAIRPWGSLPKKIWAGGGATDFAYRVEYKQSTPHELRTNALMLSANKFNIGPAPDLWSKLEPTPFPRVANILENAKLIASGVPSFELDPSKIGGIKNMAPDTRSVVLRQMVDRATAIVNYPKAAHPPTPAHAAAKEKLKEIAGGAGNAPVMSKEDAFADLSELAVQRLTPCTPRVQLEPDLTARRKQFQLRAPRCFCGKKAAAEACSFTVQAFAELLKDEAPAVYAYYIPRPGRFVKLTSDLQSVLGLEATGACARANKCDRNTFFGWTLGEKNDATDEPPCASSSAAPPSEPEELDDDDGRTPGYCHTVEATGLPDTSAEEIEHKRAERLAQRAQPKTSSKRSGGAPKAPTSKKPKPTDESSEEEEGQMSDSGSDSGSVLEESEESEESEEESDSEEEEESESSDEEKSAKGRKGKGKGKK